MVGFFSWRCSTSPPKGFFTIGCLWEVDSGHLHREMVVDASAIIFFWVAGLGNLLGRVRGQLLKASSFVPIWFFLDEWEHSPTHSVHAWPPCCRDHRQRCYTSRFQCIFDLVIKGCIREPVMETRSIAGSVFLGHRNSDRRSRVFSQRQQKPVCSKHRGWLTQVYTEDLSLNTDLKHLIIIFGLIQLCVLLASFWALSVWVFYFAVKPVVFLINKGKYIASIRSNSGQTTGFQVISTDYVLCWRFYRTWTNTADAPGHIGP